MGFRGAGRSWSRRALDGEAPGAGKLLSEKARSYRLSGSCQVRLRVTSMQRSRGNRRMSASGPAGWER